MKFPCFFLNFSDRFFFQISSRFCVWRFFFLCATRRTRIFWQRHGGGCVGSTSRTLGSVTAQSFAHFFAASSGETRAPISRSRSRLSSATRGWQVLRPRHQGLDAHGLHEESEGPRPPRAQCSPSSCAQRNAGGDHFVRRGQANADAVGGCFHGDRVCGRGQGRQGQGQRQ